MWHWGGVPYQIQQALRRGAQQQRLVLVSGCSQVVACGPQPTVHVISLQHADKCDTGGQCADSVTGFVAGCAVSGSPAVHVISL